MIVPGLVSIVIPVHNRPALLCQAVDSVLTQDWHPIELIVVDDGSSDATPTVLAEIAARHPSLVRIVRRPRPGGPGVAREAGRREIRGEFVQYLDSDDLLAPGKFRRQVEALRARPDCDLCWGRDETLIESRSGGVRRILSAAPEFDRLFPILLVSKPWQTFNPLYRRELVERMGPWAPLWNFQDWEYDGRAAVAGARPCFVDILTGSLRRGNHAHVSRPSHVRRQLGAQARVFEAMLGHAITCGIARGAPEMQTYSRRLFRHARRCGAAGLVDASRRLFALARGLAPRPDAIEWKRYEGVAGRIGWRAAGVLARALDEVRGVWRRSGT